MTRAAPPLLEPGESCWRIEQATRMSVIVDADDYFSVARSAMLKARKRIMLIGWDFDARINLGTSSEERNAPERVGAFVLWLVRNRPELEVYLLRWDVGALKSLFRGSTLFTFLKWLRHPRIHTRLDGHHPTGASHHQKIVVIDDCFAFCGGIDMTGDRWDTRAHRDHEPGRRRPSGRPYKPWHDATTALQGPVAAALGVLARERWHRAGGRRLAPVEGEYHCWPDALTPDYTDTPVAISRTVPTMPDEAHAYEIEELSLRLNASARHSIYAESQYFASRRIAEAITRRLAEPDGPEIVILNPVRAQGWLEPLAMDTARARLVEAMRKRDPHGRFRLYHPVTAGGQSIYCHAKLMVIDDRWLKVGSSNFNNRSMRLDSECDVTVEGTSEHNLLDVRDGLLAEHLGVEIGTVRESLERTGSLIATIEALRGEGRTLVPYETPDLNAVTAWLADNEVLDPEGPEEMFESFARRGLFRNWRARRHVRRLDRRYRRGTPAQA